MSVRVTLNCPVKPNQFQALLPFLQDNLANVRGFPGNLQIKVQFDEANNEMRLDEEWLSIASHQAYLSAISKNGVLDASSNFLSAAPQIKYFQKVDI